MARRIRVCCVYPFLILGDGCQCTGTSQLGGFALFHGLSKILLQHWLFVRYYTNVACVSFTLQDLSSCLTY